MMNMKAKKRKNSEDDEDEDTPKKAARENIFEREDLEVLCWDEDED